MKRLVEDEEGHHKIPKDQLVGSNERGCIVITTMMKI